jgi:hypothetical protein
VTIKEIEKVIGKPWRQVSGDVMTLFFRRKIKALGGWEYKPVRGKVGRNKLGTRFERIEGIEHEGALSSNLGPTQVYVQGTGVLSAYM